METIRLGVVPAPGLAADVCYKIRDYIGEALRKETGDRAEWKVEVKVDELTGATDQVKKIMEQAIRLKKANGWDYVVSVTDLPILDGKSVVLGDIDAKENRAQISLPAFGMVPTSKKIGAAIIRIVKALHRKKEEGILEAEAEQSDEKASGTSGKLLEVMKHSRIDKVIVDKDPKGEVERFLIRSKINGNLRVLTGLAIANRPWTLITSFKKLVGLAFATGSYMLIFNTLWKLSDAYDLLRFIALMTFAISGMIVWIIVSHNLWEKKSMNYSMEKLRHLYNAATIMTFSMSVTIFYVAMFLLFVCAVAVFVPEDLFEDAIGHAPKFTGYMKLAWLVTSAATVAGAIGAGLEDEDAVKKSAYGYRQYIRSKKVEEQEEDEEEKSKEEA